MAAAPASRAAAIAEHCKECIYDELARGGWRQQVAGCTITDCRFYAFRPMPRTIAQ